MRPLARGAVLVCLLPVVATCGDASRVASSDDLRAEWPLVGGDDGATHYSPLNQITRENVRHLRPAWTWQTIDREVTIADGTRVEPGAFETTPVMVGDTLFFTTAMSQVVALDAESGREYWRFDPELPVDPGMIEARWGMVHRGVALWTGDGARRVFVTAGPRLMALDAATGKPIPSFGEKGAASLEEGLRWKVADGSIRSTSAPVVVGDLVIAGSAIPDHIIHDNDPPGALHAFDVRTGERRWTWHTVPERGAPGSETWEGDAIDRVGHANVWSPMTADPGRGLLFANVSAASNDFYGGRRPGNNLYAESLVSLDAATGQLRWYFQYIHHGLWDYEAAAPPMLITLPTTAAPRDVVVVPGKTGFLYIFDRDTGEPLWPIEERQVPASDVPGELASPTQPFPTWPPAFSQQALTEQDLVDFTPELRARALERVSDYRLGGLFEPPSLEGTILLPGWRGGAGWGGGAYDPVNGRLFVKSSRDPILARLIPDSREGGNAGYVMDLSQPPHRRLDLILPRRHRWQLWRTVDVAIPIVKPPYGRLGAYDFPAGTLAWNLPAGDSPLVRQHPALRSLHLKALGVSGPPGPIVTAGGVVFLTGGGEELLAIDARSGAQLWSARFGLSRANPMTYRTATGRQFVVVANGEGTGGRLSAFALPPELVR
jgi:quinoprotein glucose dehydrogenase